MRDNVRKRTLEATAIIVSVIVSVGSLLATFYFQYWQGPNLEVGVAQVVLLNSWPRVGLLCSVYNSGARAGTIVRGSLHWGSATLDLAMSSPSFETWKFTLKGTRETAEETTFSYFRPVVIEPHASRAVVLWFAGDVPKRLFATGDHAVEVTFYDGAHTNPVAQKSLRIHLEESDIQHIYAHETAEFPIRIISGE